jgi:predicted transcriptional regulator
LSCHTKPQTTKGGLRDMDLKLIIEITASLVVIIGAVGGLVMRAIKKIKENKKLILNKDDGYYYDKKSKEPYCPHCYESKKLKLYINNNKCDGCGKVYKHSPVVIAVCPPPPRELPRVR